MSKPTPKVDAFASGTHVPADHQIGLVIEPHFTKGTGHHPFTQIEWEKRTVAIRDESGKVVFEQENVEVPKSWSALAGQVVASKYFRGTPGTPEREQSVRRVIGRVVDTITEWGRKGRYFVSEGDATAFEYELSYLLVNQYAAFNSPVWFNVGAEAHPQCSACFINSVDDDMGSILDLAKTEGMLFKYGSGTGSNLSAIRSSKENLNGGGSASGPVSFMRGFDAFAGAIKSGGKTRRAAKMVILDADHPDILEFIRAKATAERAAHALIEGGFDGSFNVQGGAYDLVPFQNANHSVRATDDFMEAHGYGYDDTLPRMWPLKARTTGKIVEQCSARELFEEIAKAAHFCGDPGMQFHDTINKWHTCKESGPINSSNPCSEYMFLDDTACNLASLNLMKFRNADGTLNVADFRAAVDIVFLAMEIIVGNSSYPTERIRDNSFAYRPLGLGYANLGAFLMSAGYAYDSDEGRDIAASITALMHGYANRRSAEIASQHGGPFAMFEQNRESMLDVMLNHYNAAMKLTFSGYSRAIREVWEDVMRRGQLAGFRNAQATVLAPTGTIGFMMDCDTTGVEPDIALKKTKKLVGGGTFQYVNNSVPLALETLDYSDAEIGAITQYIGDHGTIEGAPGLQPEDLSVFDCAFRPVKGTRQIAWQGHIRMMAAVQPFLSGAISKTVNMPPEATVEDIKSAYWLAWKTGVKAIAVYRDGSKKTQPLSASGGDKAPAHILVPISNNTLGTCATCQKDLKTTDTTVRRPDGGMHHLGCYQPAQPARRKLPSEVRAVRKKFRVGDHTGYFHVGEFENGDFGEIFIDINKEGSVVSGLLGALGAAVSIAVQYGVPLSKFVDKFSHTKFEPAGFTGDPEQPMASSLLDYIFRWLQRRYVDRQSEEVVQIAAPAKANVAIATDAPNASRGFVNQADAPPCGNCGMLMYRNGACYKCDNCGATSGCS